MLTFAVMKTILRISVSFLMLLACTGCELIDVHPYDTKVDGAHDINARNIARIEKACAGRTQVRFAVISDTQRWYDETAAAVASINARGDIDFVIHCGDLTDFGVTREYEWMRRELEKFAVPYVCLIGNHDCLGTGADMFRYIYGTPNFSFTAGDTHFVCLNTNSYEYDYSVAIPDFTFLKSDRAAVGPEVRRTVVVMHASPFSDQFNNNVAEIFEEKILGYPDLQFCLCGHNHYTSTSYPFDDGIPYHQCGAAKRRQYLVFTMKQEGGYDYEVADY